MSKNPSVLIIKADLSNSVSTAAKLHTSLKILDDTVDWDLCSYKELVYIFDKSGPRIEIASTKKDLASYDLVYLRDFRGYEYERNTCAQYLVTNSTKFVNSDVAQAQNISKLSQYMALSIAGIHIPNGIFCVDAQLAQEYAKALGDKVIVKDIAGVGGSDNYLVNTTSVAKTIEDCGKRCIVQQYVPNNFDVRVTVLGDTIGTVCQRVRGNATEHRNNVKQGAKKIFVDANFLPTEVQAACIKSAQVMNREIAGVDVILTDNDYAILEVNLNFGMDSDDDVPKEVIPLHSFLKKQLNK